MNKQNSFREKVMNLSVESRLNLIRKSASFFFIAGILLSYNLWLSNRFFPLIPVMEGFPAIAPPFDTWLLFLLLVLLSAGILTNHRMIYPLCLSLLTILLLEDQNRWQPWVFIYTLILLPFAVLSSRSVATVGIINYLQCLMIGMYVWSGIQKLNPSFLACTFQTILTELFRIKDPSTRQTLGQWGYLIPVVEILTGLALVLPRIRNVGVYLAVLTHVFIILFLSPVGINHNTVVYPWNVAMILLIYLLFYDLKNKLNLWHYQQKSLRILNLAIVLVVWCLPVFNFFGFWDHYLSFSLYSDKPKDYFIAIQGQELDKIDKRLFAYFMEIKGLQGGQIIDLNKWALGEMNVLVYPESRVFRRISKSFCKYGIEEDKILFLEFERPATKGNYSSFSCQDLE